MKIILITVITSIFLLGGVAWLGIEKPNALRENSTSAVLTTPTTTYDFGDLSMAAGTVVHEFTVYNDSAEPVKIGKIYTSCMCTEAALRIGDKRFGPYGMLGHGFIPKVSESLTPGQEVVLQVTFDPAAHGPAGVGRIERTITVENDAGEPLIVSFTATVTP